MDVTFENLAPDVDAIVVYIGCDQIDIWRDEEGEVFVMYTKIQGSKKDQVSMILGEWENA